MAHGDVTTGEIMGFLQEHLMTKEEIKVFVKDELRETEARILTSVDRFAKLHETLDQELVAMRSRYERLEERMEIVEHRLGLASP